MKYFPTVLFFLFVLGISASARAADATLEWDPVDGVAGYRLYYSVQGSGDMQNLDIGDNTSVDLTGLADATPYACYVTAYDVLGLESPFSNELDFTTDGGGVVLTPVVTVDPAINVTPVDGTEQGTATFNLSAPAAQPITVPFILFGTGNDGTPFTVVYSQMTFDAGSTSADVDIVEPTEDFPAFFSREAYLILPEFSDSTYQTTFTVLPIVIDAQDLSETNFDSITSQSSISPRLERRIRKRIRRLRNWHP